MKKWTYSDWHYIEINGVVYVLVEDVQKALKKIEESLKGKDDKTT